MEKDRRNTDRFAEKCRHLRERSLKVVKSWHLSVKKKVQWSVQRLVERGKLVDEKDKESSNENVLDVDSEM